MLVITRKLGEAVYIGDDIKIIVVQIKGKQIRLGIEAPKSVPVVREEIKDETPSTERRLRDDKQRSTRGQGSEDN